MRSFPRKFGWFDKSRIWGEIRCIYFLKMNETTDYQIDYQIDY